MIGLAFALLLAPCVAGFSIGAASRPSSPGLRLSAPLMAEMANGKMSFENVGRAVCGGCLDFKLCTTVPLATFGPWEEAGHPPEAEFLEKLKKIEGVSQVETQTMTNQVL